jgi:hypothetical protein
MKNKTYITLAILFSLQAAMGTDILERQQRHELDSLKSFCNRNLSDQVDVEKVINGISAREQTAGEKELVQAQIEALCKEKEFALQRSIERMRQDLESRPEAFTQNYGPYLVKKTLEQQFFYLMDEKTTIAGW